MFHINIDDINRNDIHQKNKNLNEIRQNKNKNKIHQNDMNHSNFYQNDIIRVTPIYDKIRMTKPE